VPLPAHKKPRAWPVNAATAAQAPTISSPMTACRSGSLRISRNANAAAAVTAAANSAGYSELSALTTTNTIVGAAARTMPEMRDGLSAT
jgi:hypothetical protein